MENKIKLKELQNILKEFQYEDNRTYLDQFCEVLIENKLDGQDKYFGRTKFMTPVKFESNKCKPGELVNVKITSFDQNSLYGIHKIHNVKAA